MLKCDYSTGTDISARAAAAFASCSTLYNGFSLAPSVSKPAQLSNSTYASTLLTHATQLYSLSEDTPLQTYTTAIPGVQWAYASSSFQDDQALAAVMMAVAVQASGSASSSNSSQSYLDTAASLWSSAKLNQDVVLNWDSVAPAVPILLAQIASLGSSSLQPAGGISKWQTEAETYLDRIVNGKGRGYLTPGGLLWYPGDSDLASLNPAMNAALLLFMYAPMATTSTKVTQYQVRETQFLLSVPTEACLTDRAYALLRPSLKINGTTRSATTPCPLPTSWAAIRTALRIHMTPSPAAVTTSKPSTPIPSTRRTCCTAQSSVDLPQKISFGTSEVTGRKWRCDAFGVGS